ncbi:hypothetical protein GCM10007315_29470 [Gemmobacter tilapiae]|uniref:Biopolymer transporter ExbD n=2 Tax=Neogemmobacter tilapiae TaxID=875041 RepID=A0A918TUF0_9RHOB|nr:hypothetical protein GCM10007315_29470 [Gemmobacter tilapiae]
MIDLIFLLLVFFMLATRFGGQNGLQLDVAGPSANAGGAVWNGPPRLIDLRGEGLALNGVPVAPEALVAALEPLMQDKGDALILRTGEGAGMQELGAVLDLLQKAGMVRILLVE